MVSLLPETDVTWAVNSAQELPSVWRSHCGSRITQNKGGTLEGNTVTFDLSDISDPPEIAAVIKLNHYDVVLGICGGLIIVVAVLFIFIKRKK